MRHTLLSLLAHVNPDGIPGGAADWQGQDMEMESLLASNALEARLQSKRARQVSDREAQALAMAVQKRCETALELRKGLAGLEILARVSDPAHVLLADAVLRKRVEAGLRKLWHYHMGFVFIELSVCGAAPPFGPARVGKLMASLAGTADVLNHWGVDRPLGDIARTVYLESVRDAVPNPGPIVVFTSGLYPGHSAQYNRARSGKRRWIHYGDTTGYGAGHIARDTTEAIDDFNRLNDGYEHITRAFGEGSGARFRAVGRAISALGVPDLRKHDVQRPLYALPLVEDPLGVLLGWSSETPQFPAVGEVAKEWYDRTLGPRRQELIEKARAEIDLPGTLAAILRRTGQASPGVQGELSIQA